MNQLSATKKLLTRISYFAVAILIVLGAAKHYFSWKELSTPVSLIYSIDSGLSEPEKALTKKWLGLNSRDKYFDVLEESSSPVITDIPDLLAQLKKVSSEDSQNRQLFMLGIPYSSTKKELRQIVENSFNGIERRNALLNVIVVLDLDTYHEDAKQEKQASQFEDDLIYIKYNFGGVALLVNKVAEDKLRGFGAIIEESLMTEDTFYY